MENPSTASPENRSPFRPPASSSSEVHIPATPTTQSQRIDRMMGMSYQPSPSRTIYSDRFIPSRSGSKFTLFNISNSPSESVEDASGAYKALLRSALFGDDLGISTPANGRSLSMNPPTRNIFRYKTETRQPMHSLSPWSDDQLPAGFAHNPPRKFSRSLYKVLDAPALPDDFYRNLVDWSSGNVLAVGLGNCVYLWNAYTSKVTKLCDLGVDGSVCSVEWAQPGTHLAVGTRKGKVQIWDSSRCKKIRNMDGHGSQVGALAWGSSLLSSGSNDTSILQRDVRAREDFVSKLTGHKSHICGLKWSNNDRELASGGNDNKLFIWNLNSTQPVLRFCEHRAAVRAIAWSPHRYGLLASGGGAADRCIRFWNTATNTHLSSMDTGSQVCNLVWSKNNLNELVSTHGYSNNEIIVWRYPTMSKLATLSGHSCRVLYLAISPDGQRIVTGAGDEMLRFWNVFPSPKSRNTEREIWSSFLGRTQVR